MPNNNFYRAFEDKYRGSLELIKSRLNVYLPFIDAIKKLDPQPNAIDLGCGRGEWLDLLHENAILCRGVDLDEGMLEVCRGRGFDVSQKDALAALGELDDNTYWMISGFHIVEHIPFESLQSIVQESLRVLKPGGLLILETPNPENIGVATESFYLDPTHIRPIPSQLLSFITEYYGFARTKTLRLQEPWGLHDVQKMTLSHVLGGVSSDYAVIAQKQAPVQTMSFFDELFAQEYGLSLENLTNRFEQRLLKLEAKADEAVAKADEAVAKADRAIARAEELSAKADEAWHHYAIVIHSRSWTITKPLRAIGDMVREILNRLKGTR